MRRLGKKTQILEIVFLSKNTWLFRGAYGNCSCCKGGSETIMIYVLSDIHGQKRRFESIMKQINLQPEDTLYVLGDVIDRNPDGIKILRKLMTMPNVKMILGNHEYMMLDALYYEHKDYEFGWQLRQERRMALWYQNGGGITHYYLKHIKKTTRTEIFEYLSKLPLNEEVIVNGQRFILAHAAPAELFKVYRQFASYRTVESFALWHRFTGYEDHPCDGTVIFGHTGTYHYQDDNPMRIWYGKGLIGIDCGAAYPEGEDPWTGQRGCLSCLRLNDMKEFYSEEMEVDNDSNEPENQ